MKRVIVLLLCVTSFAAANAQVGFGGKAGVNLATFSGDVEDVKMKIGYYVGGLVQIPVSESFIIQPELVFSAQGAKSEDSEDDVKANFNYLNIPIMAKYQSTSGFFAETGPQIGFLMSAKMKAGDTDVDVKEYYKSTDFNWAFGLGYQMASGFGVNARYNLGLSSIYDEDVDDEKVKNSVFQIGVFYVLGKSAN